MRAISPGLPGPTHLAGEDPGDEDGDALVTPYQLARVRDGKVVAITRWTPSADERAALVNGHDLFLHMWLDDRPLPATAVIVGPPTLSADGD